MLPDLSVVPINEAAKTIQILYKGHNPELCHDVCLEVANAFMSYDDDAQRKGDENILKFNKSNEE